MRFPITSVLECAPPLVLLGVAALSDARRRRIPNWLTASLALGGLATGAGRGGVEGALTAVAGLAVGLACLWLPWSLRLLGAGDVKLAAAAGAWLGPSRALWLILGSAVAGGVLSGCYYALAPRRERAVVRANLAALAIAPVAGLSSLRGGRSSRGVPYGIAIAVVAAALLVGRS